MTQLVHLRLDPELIAEIEAYRVKTGIKTTSEATRRLISAGLEATKSEDAMRTHAKGLIRLSAIIAEEQQAAAPSGSTRHARLEIAAERGLEKPKFQVADQAEVEAARQSKPFFKPQKGKGK